MSIGEQLPLAEVKNRLSEVVEQVESEHARVIITKRGRAAAALISADDLLSLEETLALLSDPDVMAQIRASREELLVGTAEAMTKERLTPPLSHEVRWTAAAQRAVEQLPEKVATACIQFVYAGLADNPRRVGKPLRFELESLHSARRGDYRVVYVVDEDRAVVTIMAVQDRADAYRPR